MVGYARLGVTGLIDTRNGNYSELAYKTKKQTLNKILLPDKCPPLRASLQVVIICSIDEKITVC